MKNCNQLIFSIGLLCFAAASFGQSDVVMRQDILAHDSKYIVGDEETEITKEYITALALDGMRRLFESGLEFLSRDAKSTMSEIERKEEAVECAFKHALISSENDYWSDHYIACVKATGQLGGNIRRRLRW